MQGVSSARPEEFEPPTSLSVDVQAGSTGAQDRPQSLERLASESIHVHARLLGSAANGCRNGSQAGREDHRHPIGVVPDAPVHTPAGVGRSRYQP